LKEIAEIEAATLEKLNIGLQRHTLAQHIFLVYEKKITQMITISINLLYYSFNITG